MNTLHLSGVSFGYPGHTVITETTQHWQAGLVWLHGQNGSGKSSVLKTLAGAQPALSGQLILNGMTEKTDPVAYRQQLFYVGSDDYALPWLSAQQWARFCAEMFPSFCMAEWQNQLTQFGIAGSVSQQLSALSLGTRRKHVYALAFACHPALLLLDEPYNGVDQSSCDVLDTAIITARQAGSIVVMASHQPRPALQADLHLHCQSGQMR
ncbi:ABC transporter ATP-binding protein [Undibacterium squillarum]|uniref:ABC transporter ATP-binding protein n=1 Tax=Undibacterium squillarum TaxID=1131567 RepID=UPI0035AF291E